MASATGTPETAVRFGEAEWEPSTRRLTVRGVPAKIPWRSAECLAILVEAAGEVVSKEELQERIWAGALMEDSNLAHAVATIRKSLDPAPGGGSYIDTVARMGYRLAVPVETESESLANVEANPPARRFPLRFTVLLALLLTLAVSASFFILARQQKRMRADTLVREGLLHLRRGNLAEGAKATPLFEEALSIVPDYAPALAGLAEAAARYGKGSFSATAELARKAVQSDPGCGECKAILGFVLMSRVWAWDEAGRYLRESIAMDSRVVQRRLWYGYWLSIQGRLDEAEAEAQTAISLEPARAHAHSLLASVRFFGGRYSESVAESQAALNLDPMHTAGYQWLERSHMMLGNDLEAIRVRAQHIGTWGGWTLPQQVDYSDQRRTIWLRSGRRGVAQAYLDEVSDPMPKETKRYERALWKMWIGDNQGALEELEAAVVSKPYNVVYVAVDPAFRPLHGDARFQQVLRGVGLAHVQ
ncbi:MAG: winged helix-turn-helix domain-containing protein [Bryobacterales bacterium]|nr:winged helix-turn-helix domain-containing protein [Bryobacterales bacterium]